MDREADCGQSFTESFAFYDLVTLSWKTCQRSLGGALTEYSGTWPSSGAMRNGKVFMRPTLGCLTVENESALLPTPTKSFGVNCRGWGLSKSGRKRYSEEAQQNALRFGYRPPIALLEWMMGFPENHTLIEPAVLATLSFPQPQSGQPDESMNLISSGTGTVSTTGLTLDDDLSYEEWEKLGFKLFQVRESWQWWIGDWINYGEKKYGETYKAAIEVTGKSFSTLKSVASTATDFEKCRRRHNLPFAHHQEVQSLPPEEQDEVLDNAEAEGWTKREVRDEVRQRKGETTTTKEEGEPANSSIVAVVLDAFNDADDEGKTELLQALIEASHSGLKAMMFNVLAVFFDEEGVDA